MTSAIASGSPSPPPPPPPVEFVMFEPPGLRGASHAQPAHAQPYSISTARHVAGEYLRARDCFYSGGRR